jgi:hypothetical protein
MSLLFAILFRTARRSTHQRLALDALRHLRGPDAERWCDVLLVHHGEFLRGCIAPDEQFRDFRNHVLHVGDKPWGGGPLEARRWYGRAVDSLRRREWAEAAYAAGVLSHYFSDPFLPLNTAHGEEQTKVQAGLEWSIKRSYGRLQQLIEIDQGGYPQLEAPPRDDWLERMISTGANLAHQHLDAVLQHYDLARGVRDPLAGMDEECQSLIAQCLAHAVVGVARVLEKAIGEAEVEPPLVETTLPGFLAAAAAPPRLLVQHLHDLAERMALEAMFDEAQRTGKVLKNLSPEGREIRQLYAEEVLRVPLHQLDQQRARLTGTLYGSGREERHHPNRLLIGTPRIAPHDSQAWREAQQGRSEGTGDRGQGTGDRGQRPGNRSRPKPAALPATAWRSTTQAQPPRATFHLAPGSPVVDVPGVDALAARRLEQAGVVTVGELLTAEPDKLADVLRIRQVTAQTVREWQNTAALASRVPGLRGQEAQILVACGIRRVDELAASPPQDLLEKVTAFATTDAGQRLLAGRQPPNLEQVTQWIEQAGQSPQSRAA